MLPRELADVLRPGIPALADEIIAAIGRDVEDYARPLEGPFGRALRTGVVRALERFLEDIVEPRGSSARARRIYVDLGRGEFLQGRSLDALQTAYRLGARLAWRRFVEAGKAAGTDPDVLYELGEAIFAYIEGLSAESIEGYAQAQSEAAGERSRDRRRLAALLLHDPAPGLEALAQLADPLRWQLPPTLAVLVTADADPDTLAARLGHGALAAELDGYVAAVLHDPRPAQVERALAGAAGALGPTVPWDRAARSHRRALLAHRLIAEGRLAGPFAVADEHLAELVVGSDPLLAADLEEAALAPLTELSPAQRDKLEATLRAWLDHQGRVEVVAHALGVHPQTVRYRLGRLRELFGARLDDPGERFGLALALRAASRAPAAR